MLGIFILRKLLRKNRDACHVPPKTSSEFYQTFVCVIRPIAKCCCSGNLHKRTRLWLFLQILLCYNFIWYNISESQILDFIHNLWYILPWRGWCDCRFLPPESASHLSMKTLDLDESSRWTYQKIIIFNQKDSDTPPQGPENSSILDVFFGPKIQRPCGQAVHALAWSVFGNTVVFSSLGEGDFLGHFW